MNNILTANIPEIVRFSLIALFFTALLSAVILCIGYANQNEKLLRISTKTSAISAILMLLSIIIVPLGSQYMTDSAIHHHRYELEKTDE